jgi:hypothetical protein
MPLACLKIIVGQRNVQRRVARVHTSIFAITRSLLPSRVHVCNHATNFYGCVEPCRKGLEFLSFTWDAGTPTGGKAQFANHELPSDIFPANLRVISCGYDVQPRAIRPMRSRRSKTQAKNGACTIHRSAR